MVGKRKSCYMFVCLFVCFFLSLFLSLFLCFFVCLFLCFFVCEAYIDGFVDSFISGNSCNHNKRVQKYPAPVREHHNFLNSYRYLSLIIKGAIGSKLSLFLCGRGMVINPMVGFVESRIHKWWWDDQPKKREFRPCHICQIWGFLSLIFGCGSHTRKASLWSIANHLPRPTRICVASKQYYLRLWFWSDWP